MYCFIPKFTQLLCGNAVAWRFFFIGFIRSESTSVVIESDGIAREKHDFQSVHAFVLQRITDVVCYRECSVDGIFGNFATITLQRLAIYPKSRRKRIVTSLPVNVPPKNNGRGTLAFPLRIAGGLISRLATLYRC